MWHIKVRLSALDGKAVVICVSQRICEALHDAVVALRPDWHSENGDAGGIKVVMTGTASDPPDMQDVAVRNVLQQAEALSAAWAA